MNRFFIIWCFCLCCITLPAKQLVWSEMPLFTRTDSGLGKGVSALYSGSYQNTVIAAGGCNFPGIPVADGGAKVFYDDIFVLLSAQDKTPYWHRAGRLPQPAAYGAACSISRGIVMVGGCNSAGSLASTLLLAWRDSAITTEILPPLPYAAFNIGGTALGDDVYVGGGIVDGRSVNRVSVLHLGTSVPYWEELPPFPGAPRSQPVMVALTVAGQQRIYVWGGFASATKQSPATVSTDGYYYIPSTRTWHYAGSIQPSSSVSPLTLGGAVAVPIGNTTLLALGGVNASVMQAALNREQQMAMARAQKKTTVIDSLTKAARDYLLNAPEWYKFNRQALLFDAVSGTWRSLGDYKQGALAGASLTQNGNELFLFNGEIKPGIRTPRNWHIQVMLSPELSLSPVYTDHMVLPRNKPLIIKGKSTPLQQIKLQFDTIYSTTVASSDGMWSIALPSQQAGGPYRLQFSTYTDTITLNDVMVGEVYLCSGQSNMAFELRNAIGGKDEIKTPDSLLRFYQMKEVQPTISKPWRQETLKAVEEGRYFTPTSWQCATSSLSARFSAVAYYFGKLLADSLQVPIGLICNAVGGSPTEAWVPDSALISNRMLLPMFDDWHHTLLVDDFCQERAALNTQNSSLPNPRHPYMPGYLFDAGIVPLTGYPLSGIIWYQGESNTHNTALHETLFPLLVTEWRKAWSDNIPFYYVQLSAIDRPNWGEFRDSQRRLQQLIPNSRMVVSLDLGDSLDVHPKHKREIGERLAFAALKHRYHYSTGLSPELLKVKKNKLYFTHTGSGLSTTDGHAVRGFEITYGNDVFIPCKATIKNNYIVLYTSWTPTSVRYAWDSYTTANVVNSFGLPLGTFYIDLHLK